MPRPKPHSLPVVFEKDVRLLGRFVSSAVDEETVSRLRLAHMDKKTIKTHVRLTSAGITIGEKPSKLSRIKSLYECIPSYDVHSLVIDCLQRDVILCIVNLATTQYEVTALRFDTEAEACIFMHAFDEVTNRKVLSVERAKDKHPVAAVSTKEADTNTTNSLVTMNQSQRLAGSKEKGVRHWSLSRRQQQQRRYLSQAPAGRSLRTTEGEVKDEELVSASRFLPQATNSADTSPESSNTTRYPPAHTGDDRHSPAHTGDQHSTAYKLATEKTTPQTAISGQEKLSSSQKAVARQRDSVDSLARIFKEERRAAVAGVVSDADNRSDLAPSIVVNKVKHAGGRAMDNGTWSSVGAGGSSLRGDRMSVVSQMSDSVRDEISNIHRDVKDIKHLVGRLHQQFSDVRSTDTKHPPAITTRPASYSGHDDEVIERGRYKTKLTLGGIEKRHTVHGDMYNTPPVDPHPMPRRRTPDQQQVRVQSTKQDERPSCVARMMVDDHREQLYMRPVSVAMPTISHQQQHQQQQQGYGTLTKTKSHHTAQPFSTDNTSTYYNASQPVAYSQTYAKYPQGPPYPGIALLQQHTPAYQQQEIVVDYHPLRTVPLPSTLPRLPPRVAHVSPYPTQQHGYQQQTSVMPEQRRTRVPIEIVEMVPIDRGRPFKKNNRKRSKTGTTSKSRSQSHEHNWSLNGERSREGSRSASRESSQRTIGQSRPVVEQQTVHLPEVVSDIVRHSTKQGQPVHVYGVVRI